MRNAEKTHEMRFELVLKTNAEACSGRGESLQHEFGDPDCQSDVRSHYLTEKIHPAEQPTVHP